MAETRPDQFKMENQSKGSYSRRAFILSCFYFKYNVVSTHVHHFLFQLALLNPPYSHWLSWSMHPNSPLPLVQPGLCLVQPPPLSTPYFCGHPITLSTEDLSSSEMLVISITWFSVPGDSYLHTHCHENLISH